MKKSLQQRAQLLSSIRQFFAEREVTEVETPLLYPTPVTDPYLKAFAVPYQGENLYLQTSPEYAMKRLLAAGSGPIYQICKAFRDEEFGHWHRPEFTMLEWYRPGFSEKDLIAEVDALMRFVLGTEALEQRSYRALFEQFLGVNPHQLDLPQAQALLNKHIDGQGLDSINVDDILMLLFSQCIEPHIGQDRPMIVTDFPASQSALAKSKMVDGDACAARFELYFHGVELANAYDEENDAEKLRNRFEADLKIRDELGLPTVPIDEKLLAITTQIPDSCGIALGLDRLLMLQIGVSDIRDVLGIG